MAKICGVCKGSGWYGPRTDLGRSFGQKSGGPCRACGGSGYDKRWGEKSCRGCSNTIEYRYDWSNIPEYCKDCRADQYKACANPHCNGTVRYKKFWDNIPKYCSTCKGWAEKDCRNGCGNKIRFRCDWNNIPDICDTCRKKRNSRSDQGSERQNMQRLINDFPELKNPGNRNPFHRYLETHYVRGVDKPTSYEELKSAYFDFLGK